MTGWHWFEDSKRLKKFREEEEKLKLWEELQDKKRAQENELWEEFEDYFQVSGFYEKTGRHPGQQKMATEPKQRHQDVELGEDFDELST